MGSKPSTRTTSIAAQALPARSVEPSPSAVADTNMALVIGRLVAEPESRTLPSGSIAVSFSLTVRQQVDRGEDHVGASGLVRPSEAGSEMGCW